MSKGKKPPQSNTPPSPTPTDGSSTPIAPPSPPSPPPTITTTVTSEPSPPASSSLAHPTQATRVSNSNAPSSLVPSQQTTTQKASRKNLDYTHDHERIIFDWYSDNWEMAYNKTTHKTSGSNEVKKSLHKYFVRILKRDPERIGKIDFSILDGGKLVRKWNSMRIAYRKTDTYKKLKARGLMSTGHGQHTLEPTAMTEAERTEDEWVRMMWDLWKDTPTDNPPSTMTLASCPAPTQPILPSTDAPALLRRGVSFEQQWDNIGEEEHYNHWDEEDLIASAGEDNMNEDEDEDEEDDDEEETPVLAPSSPLRLVGSSLSGPQEHPNPNPRHSAVPPPLRRQRSALVNEALGNPSSSGSISPVRRRLGSSTCPATPSVGGSNVSMSTASRSWTGPRTGTFTHSLDALVQNRDERQKSFDAHLAERNRIDNQRMALEMQKAENEKNRIALEYKRHKDTMRLLNNRMDRMEKYSHQRHKKQRLEQIRDPAWKGKGVGSESMDDSNTSDTNSSNSE